MRNRSFWLTSHLLAEPAGAATQRVLDGMPRAAHEEILTRGDHLAEVSVLIAQQYFRMAPAAWNAFGATGFRNWVQLGEGIAAAELSTREGALAFFRVSPESFGPDPMRTAAAWCAIAAELSQTSRKLAAIFLGTTAPVLHRADALARLKEWATVGIRLYGDHGWQGEFLAQSFLASAPKVLQLLPPRLYQLWAGTGAALYIGAKDRTVFEALPHGLHHWKESDYEHFFRITLALASVAPKNATTFFRGLPESLIGIDPDVRTGLLRTLVPGARKSAAAIAEFVPVAGAVLRQIPALQAIEAFALIDGLAKGFPDGVVATLRVLPRIYEEAAPKQIREWFRTGIEVAKENGQAGLAYFALESRTSLNVLGAASTGVNLEGAQGVLRKYLQMMSGEPASIRSADRFSVLVPIEEFPHENEIALPLRIDLLDTHEDNFQLYRLLATQLAGRREFGTYDFKPPPGTAIPDESPGRALWSYLDAPERPQLLTELFLLAEGFRIHTRIAGDYPGTVGDTQRVVRKLIAVWATSQGARRGLDGLFAYFLSGLPLAECPDWLEPDVAAVAIRLFAPLLLRNATVNDSMQIAEELARVLVQPSRYRSHYDDGVNFEQLAAEAMFDPYTYDEEGTPSAGPRADPVPAAPDQVPAQEDLELELSEDPDDPGGGIPMSPEELRKLLEAGVKLDIKQASGEDLEGLGLYITDLIGKIPSDQLDELRKLVGDADPNRPRGGRRWMEQQPQGAVFYYDEWDYHIGDYRSRWCRLNEINLDGDSGEFYNQAMSDYARLIPEVRRQFQRIRPETYRIVRGLEDGEDFDLNAAIDAHIDRRARRSPSSKLYIAKQREERDVATLFLLDMSASTDEPMAKAPPAAEGAADWLSDPRALAPSRMGANPGRRIIDVTKEALVIMAAALDEIGDAFAIYGFSGHGRHNVEMYRVKSFKEALSPTVKGRIGDIQPRRSTRMGTALRHAIEKLSTVSSRSKHLFLLSDGFPQDHDYGQDRRSNLYGIRDTTVALREVEAAGITPFCITVDKAGHDYLREMCDESRYMVIEDISQLPRELPKIYQRIVR